MKSPKKSAFSIIFAMGFVLITSLTSIYLLSFIIPFSKNIKGVEFSTNSYYNAYSGVEEALYLYGSGAQNKQYGYEVVKNVAGPQDFGYDISSVGNRIPDLGEGDSDYDSDWNRISPSEPIQLFVGRNNIWNGGSVGLPTLQFRTPNISGTRPQLAGATSSGVILWQLSSLTDTLYPRNTTFITYGNINAGANGTNIGANFGSRGGQTVNNTLTSIDSFYSSNCSGVNSSCSLKFSIIGNLTDTTGTNVPYLEYRIISTNTIPVRFSKILAEGNYNGYLKTLEVNIPQQTLNQAFDFTVFQ